MLNKSLIVKIISMTLLGAVSGTIVPVQAMSLFEGGSEEDGVSFAVISDVHIKSTASKEDAKFAKALNTINEKSPNLDAIVVAGDLTDHGYLTEEKRFMDIYNQNANLDAEKLFVMGNHDFWNGLSPELATKQFETVMGVKANTHKVLNGFHFIQVTSEGSSSNGAFNNGQLEWTKSQLEEANKEDPNKPIFVTVHEHISDTVYGSDDWGYTALYDILKDYPQVVTFSGHSHYSIEDERSIHQKDFTSVGTSSLSYMELEQGKIQGSVPAGASDYSQGMIVNVDEDNKVTIERLDFHNDKEIKEPWVVTPNKSEFIYTDERALNRMNPTFEDNDNVEITNIGKNSASITFDQGNHSDFVHSYSVEVINKDLGTVERSFLAFSEFYKPVMPEKLTFNITGLKQDTNYIANVYAIESFGKESETPLKAEFKTLEDVIDENVEKPKADVFDLSFIDGTLKDNSINNANSTIVGNVGIEYDSTVKKNVAKFNGYNNNYIKSEFTTEQKNQVSEQFTLETVFKMNKIKNQGILMNTEGGGIGFESTSSGLVEIWAHIGGSYKRVGVKLEANKYYHILAAYNGSSLDLYLDGELVNSMPATGKVYHPNVAFAVGGDPSPSGAGIVLDGNVSLARLYSKGVNVSEVKKLYKEYSDRSSLENIEDVKSKQSEINEKLALNYQEKAPNLKDTIDELNSLLTQGTKVIESLDTTSKDIEEYVELVNNSLTKYDNIYKLNEELLNKIAEVQELINSTTGFVDAKKVLEECIAKAQLFISSTTGNVGGYKTALNEVEVAIEEFNALVEKGEFIAWEANTTYNVGDIVSYNGKTYVCVQGHTALENWVPDQVLALWTEVTVSDNENEWSISKDYNLGDIVEYNGEQYECITAHKSQGTWTPEFASSLWRKAENTEVNITVE